MFITKRALSRRTVLRGIGATVALPLLDAMVPARATGAERAAVLPRSRFTGIEMVHGSAGSTEYGTTNHLWTPTTTGRDFEFTKILKPLEPFRDHLTVVSHTDCSGADPFTAEEVGADHFRSSAVFLTAAHPKQTEGSDIRNGPSIDQLYAKAHGQDCRDLHEVGDAHGVAVHRAVVEAGQVGGRDHVLGERAAQRR